MARELAGYAYSRRSRCGNSFAVSEGLTRNALRYITGRWWCGVQRGEDATEDHSNLQIEAYIKDAPLLTSLKACFLE